MTSGEITNGELMEQLLVIKGDVGETKGKLGNFITTHEDRVFDIENRVRSVEQKQYWFSGAGTIFGMVAGWFGAGHLKF